MRRQLRIRPRTIAWVIGGLLALVGPAAAQGGNGPGGGDGGRPAEEDLQRTDEGLDRARDIVRESDSLRARTTLEQAFALQEQAWNRYRNGRETIARALTREARQIGARAVSLAREDAQLRNRAQEEGERAKRALQRARDVSRGNAGSHQLRLLDEARAQIDRAVVQFHEQHFEAAMRLAISAQRLIRQAEGAGGDATAPRVLREIERTDRLVERALPVVRESGDGEAEEILRRATDLQAQAWESYRAGRLRGAHAATREARGLVNRALALVRGPVDAARLEAALADTDALLARVENRVRESGNETGVRVLEMARKHQRQATDLLADGKLREALAKTRVARRLAMRAAALSEGGSER